MHTKNVHCNPYSHFFVVDGDAWIDDEFDFSYVPSTTDEVYPELVLHNAHMFGEQ